MKKLVLLICFFPILIYSEVLTIYTAKNTEYKVEDFRKILSETISKIDSSKTTDNLILYIHGHGKHPEKGVKKRIPKLEKDYSAKVIMIHWNSWNGKKIYPARQAEDAGLELFQIFNQLLEFKTKYPKKYYAVKPTLFIHSMGNQVFQKYILNTNRTIYKDLFNNIILNAPDVDTKNHHQWVAQITESERIYITFNKKDLVLQSSAKIVNHDIRLGQKLHSMFWGDAELSDNAIYLDFSDTGVFHMYYNFDKQKENEAIHLFYQNVLNGNKANLELKDKYKKVKENVYVVRS